MRAGGVEHVMLCAKDCIYLHGIPGAPEELLMFESGARAVQAGLVVPDRTARTLGKGQCLQLDALAGDIANVYSGRALTLIGFSLGAKIALELAVRLGDKVSRIHLISPAGPLQLGNYLPEMAGGSVFKLATSAPTTFRILTLAQGLLVRTAPQMLFKRIFSSACGEDALLAALPSFRQRLISILDTNLQNGASNYRFEIAAYVQPWAPLLDRITQPVIIWQGDSDTWTPPSMAADLATALKSMQKVHVMAGLGHYSTLRAALARLDLH